MKNESSAFRTLLSGQTMLKRRQIKSCTYTMISFMKDSVIPLQLLDCFCQSTGRILISIAGRP